MIVHIALFKWKSNVSPKDIEQILADVRLLKSKVEGIIEIHCGENFSKWNEGFTHAFVIFAKDRIALESYRNHPDHKDVANRIEKIEGKSIGLDFES